MRKTLFLILIGLFSFVAAQAQFDPAFGSGGKVITNIGNSTFHVIVQALQPDGKLLMAGNMNDGFNVDKGFVCRVHADGTLDTSFSGGKIIIESLGSCKAIKLQADGKIVIGGSFDGEISLARFNTDGTTDTTFGNGGHVYTLDTFPNKNLYDMILQPDGKIVVLSNYLNAAYRLMRFNPDGNPDTTFGAGGWVAPSSGTTLSSKPITTILQADGKLLVGGYTFGTGSSYFVTRHNSDGTIDTTFNGTGRKSITHTYSSNLYGIALQSDGKIVYNGKATGPNVLATGRLNADGTIDTTFGTDGSTLTSLNIDASDNNGKIKILPDGKIFALNRISYADGFQDIFMIRYNTDGSPDTTFNGDGTKVFAYGSGNDFGRDFDLVGNKIWISGNTDINFIENNIAMARFNSDGTSDNTFNGDGKAFLYFVRNSEDEAEAITIQSDDKIIVGGSTYSNTKDYQSIVRYLSDGSIDSTFGTGGKVLMNKPGKVTSIAIRPDGKILAAGHDGNFIYVTRFDTDGSVDNAFSDSLITAGLNYGGWMLTAMQLLPNGKILIAGRKFMSPLSSNFDYVLIRLNTDGTVDNSFGVNGYCTQGSMSNKNELITSLKVLPDGKILAGGQFWLDSAPPHYTLLRYTANGTLDTSFANGGIYDGVIPEDGSAVVSIDVQSDGKIVTGIGDYFSVSHYGFMTARFNANGTLDTTFADNGFAKTDSENNARVTNVKLLADQKIMATGTSYSATSNFAVAKYNSDGSPDETFAPNGFFVADFNNTFEVMNAATITADNRIVACGRIYDETLGTHDYALAKFNTDGTLGLGDYQQEKTGFYPNPAHGKVIFMQNIQSVSLFTPEGKAIKNLEVMNNEININELSNGIYLLRYTTKDGSTKTDKLIKN